MQYRDPSFMPELRRSRPFLEEKSRKEAVRLAAMGEEGVQRPVVRLEGGWGAEVEGWECCVRGFWKTGRENVREMSRVGGRERTVFLLDVDGVLFVCAGHRVFRDYLVRFV